MKKRLFFSNPHLSQSESPHLPLQPIWVSAPNGMLTPVVTGNTGVLTPVVPCNSEIHTPPPPDADQGVHYYGNLTADVGIGWRVHKHSGHPICGFNHVFPSGSPTFVMANPMMAISPGSLPMSPSIGSLSRMEHFLPNNLLCSDANSNLSMTMSDAVTPMGGGNQANCFTGPCMTLQRDDRWSCIPSGMVERRKAQFETTGGQDGSAPVAPDDIETRTTRAEAQFETTGAQDGGAPVAPDDIETRTTRAEAQFEPPAAADGIPSVASEGTETRTMRAVDDGDGWLGCGNEHVHEWCVTSDAYPNDGQKGEKP